MHGGGYVIGSKELDGPLLDGLCLELGVVGVSVDYRLAPETPYPGPLEDCYRGLLWAFDHADELGIDRDRIGVMGSSAGGGLAAALVMLARDRAQMSLAFQLLDAPMLDDRQITPSSQTSPTLSASAPPGASSTARGRDGPPAAAAIRCAGAGLIGFVLVLVILELGRRTRCRPIEAGGQDARISVESTTS